jgi:hypothetical protein
VVEFAEKQWINAFAAEKLCRCSIFFELNSAQFELQVGPQLVAQAFAAFS